jgi:hypothetical protein
VCCGFAAVDAPAPWRFRRTAILLADSRLCVAQPVFIRRALSWRVALARVNFHPPPADSLSRGPVAAPAASSPGWLFMNSSPRFTASALGLLMALAGGAALAQAPATPPAAAAPSQSQPPAAAEAPQIKQVKLTEKQVQQVLAAQKAMDALTDKLPEDGKPDPKLLAQLEGVAKKNGFATYAEYGDVVDNITLVLSGIDPKTKAFTQPPEVLKQQLAALQADTKMPAKDKQAALDDLNAALKATPTVQFPENVALVTKYYDKLAAALQEDE